MALVGHVASSPAVLTGWGRWFTLGLISVTPTRQRTGIGSALIVYGFAGLREAGAAGCMVIGDPAYYRRLRFRNDLGLSAGDFSARNVMGIAFGGDTPTGEIAFAPSLD
ncbi:MAG: hypothetical protein WBA67_15740 [Jannaschia sp.]